ncbi:spliceosome-associated protein CWC27 homolog [Dendroctonus ponderosae]|uniref:spliceosome-associated protein CWC27 homolog n=1 Tax=Dendroctonus ponderosae TaxID=77166 RepID=UPI002035761E|nr:spliceosome-associated protein CWC27 homolog [Dendroctonus ponderosae]KAH1014778.1 hypothetical protein HUJ05_012605 [Dendroctonus ponderosae]
MSNIYILEPPTSGKVLLKTTAGDIDIELWSKETPKACRNFIQLCLEGYYDNTIFHRVVKDFIVQGGDPKGDGTGGESIYGEPFKDEFHQRLKFARRGLLAMANAGKDDNGSQFFFTLAATPELQNKHTIFGKVSGNTVFNMLKLAEGLVEDERPVYPYKITKTEVLNNPFADIQPRVKQAPTQEKKKKEKKAGVKNFKLLSFGEEAEEDEEISTKESEKLSARGKSSHDILDDPKLSSQTDIRETEPNEDRAEDAEKQLENIRKKLKTSHKKPKPVEPKPAKPAMSAEADDDDALEDYYLHKDRDRENQKKMEELKKEIKSVKQEYHKNKLRKEEEQKEQLQDDSDKSEIFKSYKTSLVSYEPKKTTLLKKNVNREKDTLKLLESFKTKLHSNGNDSDIEEAEAASKSDEDDDNWINHKLTFSDNVVLAKDANTKSDDWFEIYDPRNPINKRRRGETSKKQK